MNQDDVEEKSEFIDVSEDALKEMLFLGAARLVDGGYEITPKFQEWLDAWCQKRIDALKRGEHV